MKHKYNVGDKVVYIDSTGYYLEMKNIIIDRVYSEENGVIYEDDRLCEFVESELFTPKKAIEFLTNYINKEE